MTLSKARERIVGDSFLLWPLASSFW